MTGTGTLAAPLELVQEAAPGMPSCELVALADGAELAAIGDDGSDHSESE